MGLLVGVDTGGTFTDFVAFDRETGRVILRKALTRYDDLVEGVLTCAADANLEVRNFSSIKHGSTHVINAFLQRRGASAALVASAGFRDVLYIARCGRPRDFDLHFQPDEPLIPRSRTFEISARMGADGKELVPVDEAELAQVVGQLEKSGVESVAISFLNSYLNNTHEEIVADYISSALPRLYVTTGSRLSREWFEFERTATAAANAYVGPSTKGYLARFGARLRSLGNDQPFYMMASHGGVLTVEEAAKSPIALVESGPVGGCIGAASYARALGLKNVVAFDMGGTTAKCALVEDGRFEVQSTYAVGGTERGFPIRTNVIDIVEVGAGGGSIASVDAVGRLSVGPKSAGAEPGPVAFRRGGLEPTVTDANVVLGRIDSKNFMGGALSFDVEGAASAIMARVGQPLGYSPSEIDKVAQGILSLASLTMGDAVREITIERGRDVRDYDLLVFGGGGPLHAAALARQLHIPRVIVPPEPGNFSALGMLMAEARLDESRTIVRPLDSISLREIVDLAETVLALSRDDIRTQFGLEPGAHQSDIEMRYKGQKHALRVPLDLKTSADALAKVFNAAYARRYGHSDPEKALEIVGLHLSVFAPTDRPSLEQLKPFNHLAEAKETGRRSVFFEDIGRRIDTPIFVRDSLPEGFSMEGPAIIEEYGSTTVVGPLDRFSIGSLGEILIYCD